MNVNPNSEQMILQAFERFKGALGQAVFERKGPSLMDDLKYPFLLPENDTNELKKEEHRWFFEDSPFKRNAPLQQALSDLLEVCPYARLTQTWGDYRLIHSLTKSIALVPFMNAIYTYNTPLPWIAQHGSSANIEKMQQKIIAENAPVAVHELLTCQDKNTALTLLNNRVPLVSWNPEALKFIHDADIFHAFIHSSSFQEEMLKRPELNTWVPQYMEGRHGDYQFTHDFHHIQFRPKKNLNMEGLGLKTMDNLCVAAHYLLEHPSKQNNDILSECLPLLYWAAPLEKAIDLFETIEFDDEQLNLIAQTLFRHSYGLDEQPHFKEKAQYLQERLQELQNPSPSPRKHASTFVSIEILKDGGHFKFNKNPAPDFLTQACLEWAKLSAQPLTHLESLNSVIPFLEHQWETFKLSTIGEGGVPPKVVQMEDLFEKTPFYIPWLKDAFQHAIANAHLMSEPEKKQWAPIAGLVAFHRPDYCEPVQDPLRLLLNETGELRDALELALMASTLCTNSFVAGLPIKQRNHMINNYDVSTILQDDIQKDHYNRYLLMTQGLLKTIPNPQFQKWLPQVQKNFVLYSDSRLSFLNEMCYKTYIKPTPSRTPPPRPDRF